MNLELSRLDGLKMFLLVIVRPNSAFATIRDNADRYFWWSMGGLGLSTVTEYFILPLLFSEWNISYFILFLLELVTFFLFVRILIWFINRVKSDVHQWRRIFSMSGYVWTVVTLPVLITDPLLYVFDLTIIRDLAYIIMLIWLVILMVNVVKVLYKEFNTWGALLAVLITCVVIIIFDSFVQAVLW